MFVCDRDRHQTLGSMLTESSPSPLNSVIQNLIVVGGHYVGIKPPGGLKITSPHGERGVQGPFPVKFVKFIGANGEF